MTAFHSGDFRIDVRMSGPAEDDLHVALQAPDGRLLHEYSERVEGETARAIYQALMTAMACAIREDCRELTVDFAPAGLLALVRDEMAPSLGPVERNLQRWLQTQLQLFDRVWMHGRPLKMGTLGAVSADVALHARLFRQGMA
jgi:hypothetical protein